MGKAEDAFYLLYLVMELQIPELGSVSSERRSICILSGFLATFSFKTWLRNELISTFMSVELVGVSDPS
jgi:hypothetical protein